MPSLVRYPCEFLYATNLSALSRVKRLQLADLSTRRGALRRWLRANTTPIDVVLALDGPVVLGWAAASRLESLLGVYVYSGFRRLGIGTALMDRLCAEVARRWPGVEWTTSTSPGSAGRKFMEQHDRRLRAV